MMYFPTSTWGLSGSRHHTNTRLSRLWNSPQDLAYLNSSPKNFFNASMKKSLAQNSNNRWSGFMLEEKLLVCPLLLLFKITTYGFEKQIWNPKNHPVLSSILPDPMMLPSQPLPRPQNNLSIEKKLQNFILPVWYICPRKNWKEKRNVVINWNISLTGFQSLHFWIQVA